MPSLLLLIAALLAFTAAQTAGAKEGNFADPFASLAQDAAARGPGISVDSRFSAAERAVIEQGAALIPACHRHKLDGLRFVRSLELDGPLDECTEGFYPGNGSIVLYPRCGFAVSVVVHELFHHLGRFQNLNGIWKRQVLRKFPGCPVSDYAADGLGGNNEDLAETGRLLLVPGSGDRRRGACVDQKIRELARILAGC